MRKMPLPITDARSWVASQGIIPWYARGRVFSPLGLAGLKLWLDAADLGSITESSGAVNQWNDKSGQGNHATQGTGAAQPLLVTNVQNGLPVIRFDGSNDCLNAASGKTFSQPSTWMVVFKLNSGTNKDIVGGIGPANENSVFVDGTGYLGMYAPSTGVTSAVSPSGFQIVTAVFNGATSNLWRNSTLIRSNVTVGGSATLGLQIGASMSNKFSESDICEALFVNAAISNDDRAATVAYLAAKWGITL